MDAQTKRQHLDDHRHAAREIELAGICIGILEIMRDPAVDRCIKALKVSQQRQLKRMEQAAEKLGVD